MTQNIENTGQCIVQLIRGNLFPWGLLAALALSVPCNSQAGQAVDATAIELAAGTEASVTDNGVVRIGWVRDDVELTVDGMDFPPSAGLGSWAAFKKLPDGSAMIMGDTVVFQDEVSTAMDEAFSHGLEITALHNHFFFDEPKVYFMHIGGRGEPEVLARGVKAVWDAIKQVRKKNPRPAKRFGEGSVPQPGKGNIDPEFIKRTTWL